MIDEENKSATMTEAPAAPAAAPAHAAPVDSAPVEPEDTVFSLPLSHVTHDYSALADDEGAAHDPIFDCKRSIYSTWQMMQKIREVYA